MRTIKALIEILDEEAQKYIQELDITKTPKEHGILLLKRIYKQIDFMNANTGTSKNDVKIAKPLTLNASCMATLARRIYIFRNVYMQTTTRSEVDKEIKLRNMSDTELCIYDPEEGIYINDPDYIYRKVVDIQTHVSGKVMQEALKLIHVHAPLAERETDPFLVPVQNGIFNYRTKELKPFSPDHIFLTKYPVSYNPLATNQTIVNPDDGYQWNVKDWIKEIADDDPSIEKLLWDIITALMLYGYPWNKCFWLYSPKGNNGKGTFCQLLKNLVGTDNYTSLTISDFGETFALMGLETKTAVITDENDVGEYIEKVGRLKALITGDTIMVNRKYQKPITLSFKGLIVQCVNKIPKIQDDSDSWTRRLVIIPFNKCFTGKERKYIKNDYLLRRTVLEYVLKEALENTITEIQIPDACKDLLEDYRETNNPILTFLNEIQDQLVWDLIPYNFLYDLYLKWMEKNNPNGRPKNKKNFTNDLKELLDENPIWQWNPTRKCIKSANKIATFEPLILEYNLESWMNPSYKGNDPEKKCDFPKAVTYYGLTRKQKNNSQLTTDSISYKNTYCQDTHKQFPEGIPICIPPEEA